MESEFNTVHMPRLSGPLSDLCELLPIPVRKRHAPRLPRNERCALPVPHIAEVEKPTEGVTPAALVRALLARLVRKVLMWLGAVEMHK